MKNQDGKTCNSLSKSKTLTDMHCPAAGLQVSRDSFGHYFSQLKEQNEVTWTPTPLEALLDVDQIIEAWRLRNLTIHRVLRLLLL